MASVAVYAVSIFFVLVCSGVFFTSWVLVLEVVVLEIVMALLLFSCDRYLVV